VIFLTCDSLGKSPTFRSLIKIGMKKKRKEKKKRRRKRRRRKEKEEREEEQEWVEGYVSFLLQLLLYRVYQKCGKPLIFRKIRI